MSSLQSQYLLCPPLACDTARTHQHPKIVTSGYFTWETGPWQQEKQHQISKVSNEYRHRQSETVSVKTAMHPPDVLTLAQYWDVGIDLQGSNGTRVRGWDLQNWRRVWFSDESRCMLQTRDDCIRVYRRRNERFARNCVLEVDNFGGGSVKMGGVPYPTTEKLNWCTSPTTLAPLDTEMSFWHHTYCPQWTSVGTFFSTTTLGRTQFVLLLTF